MKTFLSHACIFSLGLVLGYYLLAQAARNDELLRSVPTSPVTDTAQPPVRFELPTVASPTDEARLVQPEIETPEPSDSVKPERLIRNQHERAIVNFLSEYPGEPVDRVFTRAMNSRDAKTQELIFGLMLGAFPHKKGIENAKKELGDHTLNGRDAAAANFFEAHGEDEEVNWLQQEVTKLQFPDGFALAMTLERMGEPGSMQLWCDAAVIACEGDSASCKRVLKCCAIYASEQTTKLLQSLVNSSFEDVSKRARELLGNLDGGSLKQ